MVRKKLHSSAISCRPSCFDSTIVQVHPCKNPAAGSIIRRLMRRITVVPARFCTAATVTRENSVSVASKLRPSLNCPVAANAVTATTALSSVSHVPTVRKVRSAGISVGPHSILPLKSIDNKKKFPYTAHHRRFLLFSGMVGSSFPAVPAKRSAVNVSLVCWKAVMC